MATVPTIIRFAQSDQTLTFCVEGRATMLHSLPLRRVADRAINGGASVVRVDLRGCTHMDSTFLGTLLTLKKILERGGGQLQLLAPSPSCERILHQMGLSDILTACDAPAETHTDWQEVPCDPVDSNSFRRNVVQAHEELARLPGDSGDQFKAVVRSIQDADRAASRPSKTGE